MCPTGYCQIHHIDWWRNHRNPDLTNLAPVCSKDHHLIHDHHWNLTLDPHRVGTLNRKEAPTNVPSKSPHSFNDRVDREPFPKPARRTRSKNAGDVSAKPKPEAFPSTTPNLTPS
jgi:hypothetical protein